MVSMKLVLATPLYPPQAGGPAKYAKGIAEECRRRGHQVTVVAYGSVERTLPPGLRHLWYFSRVLSASFSAGHILSLDTLSVGVPAAAAARITRTPLSLRIGGDFLWEAYVNRTHELRTLSTFYGAVSFSRKERAIFSATKFVLRSAHVAFFTTPWQRAIWERAYGSLSKQVRILENVYPESDVHAFEEPKTFVMASRGSFLKNQDAVTRVWDGLKKAHPGIVLDTRVLPPDEHHARLRRAYAVLVPTLSEVSPNEAIEARAAGKPFLLTDDCGIRDRLAGAGVFVDTTDDGAVAAGIETLLDAESYDRFSKAALPQLSCAAGARSSMTSSLR